MRHVKLLFFCTLCLLAGGVVGWAQAPIAELSSLTAKDTPFIDGDRLVFLGDSITQIGDGPGGYVSLFRDVFAGTAHPGVTVINAGISGNTVPDLQARFATDVLAKNPSVVLIYIGINDVWHYNGDLGEPKTRYVAGLREIIGALQRAGSDRRAHHPQRHRGEARRRQPARCRAG